MNERIEEAKRKRNLLIAKQKRAQAQKRIHETLSGLSDTSAFDSFNRMAERIEDEERRNLAAAEVTEALTGGTIEEEFLKLEAGDDADERLAALKREMGLLGPGEGEKKQLSAGTKDGRSSSKGTVPDGRIQEAELLEEFDRLEKDSRA
jgi:phage shock protein A